MHIVSDYVYGCRKCHCDRQNAYRVCLLLWMPAISLRQANLHLVLQGFKSQSDSWSKLLFAAFSWMIILLQSLSFNVVSCLHILLASEPISENVINQMDLEVIDKMTSLLRVWVEMCQSSIQAVSAANWFEMSATCRPTCLWPNCLWFVKNEDWIERVKLWYFNC
jgi:hypothetical protein